MVLRFYNQAIFFQYLISDLTTSQYPKIPRYTAQVYLWQNVARLLTDQVKSHSYFGFQVTYIILTAELSHSYYEYAFYAM